MPRVNVNVTQINGTYGEITSIGVGTASNVSDLNQCLLTGRILLIAENTNAANVNIAINSTAIKGRYGNIAKVLQTTERWSKIFTNPEGWVQSDGYLYFSADNADVKWTAVRLPATD